MPAEFSGDLNAHWGAHLLNGLRTLGIQHIVISPGSRSTPITLAAARVSRPLQHVILDERCAAFFALGLARLQRTPVALVATSGSAPGHWMPAVMEACESGVPLILLSADRPPELRHSRAGQTTDQTRLFGRFVRFFAEMPVPAARPEVFAQAGSILQDAVEVARSGSMGPVHLNCPFDEPLSPRQPPPDQCDPRLAGQEFRVSIRPRLGVQPEWEFPIGELPSKGVILSGWANPVDRARWVERACELSRSLGWPIWADASSPLRHAPCAADLLVNGYDALSRAGRMRGRRIPEAVIVLNEPPLSKSTRQWLTEVRPLCWTISNRIPVGNSLGIPSRNFHGDLESLRITAASKRHPDSSWFGSWRRWHDRYNEGLDEFVAKGAILCGPRILYHASRSIPSGAPVWIASSMPVRDAEWFGWSTPGMEHRVSVNRGLNGIDGMVSSALGMSAAAGRHGYLITGDLALLHDVGGLANRRQARHGLTILLINNDGGGIFDHLPIARWNPPFEEYFATPQSVDVGALAEAFSWDYHAVDGMDDLVKLLMRHEGSCRIIEVRCRREDEVQYRNDFFKQMIE